LIVERRVAGRIPAFLVFSNYFRTGHSSDFGSVGFRPALVWRGVTGVFAIRYDGLRHPFGRRGGFAVPYRGGSHPVGEIL
jgi:hypothetical protein